MISRIRGGPKRDSDIIQSDVTDWWGFVGLIFREKLYPHFRRALVPLGLSMMLLSMNGVQLFVGGSVWMFK